MDTLLDTLLSSRGRAVFAGGLTCVACCLAAAPAAQAAPAFAIAPATKTAHDYFVMNAAPGARLTRRVKVTNVGDSAGSARLYAVDATTGRTTGAVYLGAERRRQDVGAWVDLRSGRLRLAPRQSKTVTFTVRVPERVRGGQHLGGIVADNASLTKGKTKQRGDGRFKIDLHHLTITAVQVNLPAKPADRMSIGGLSADGRPGYQTVLVDLASSGNRMIKPALDVEVKDGGGKKVLRRTTKLDTILPDTRIDYPVAVLGRGLAAGTYTGTVVLRLGGKVLDRYSGSFKVTDKQVAQVFGNKAGPSAPGEDLPWKAIVAGVLALLLAAAAAFGIRSVRRRRAVAAERRAAAAASAAEAARQKLEAEARRLRELEERETQVAERERVEAEREQALDARDSDLRDFDQATAARADAVEHAERLLGEREAGATLRGQELEQRQILLEERERAAALRADELERDRLRLVERDAQDAVSRRELHDGERRLREREEEVSARVHQHQLDEAASRHALSERERALDEREAAVSERERALDEREAAHRFQQSMRSAAARNGGTLASRLRRRIGA